MTEESHRPDSIASRRGRPPQQIGEWTLYPEQGVMRRGDREVRLGEKALHVLLVLLDAGNSPVPRADLLESVWGEHYPTDSVVSRAIADLRAAFGESAGEQAYIRTLPKYGYQLVAERENARSPDASIGRPPTRRLAWLILPIVIGGVVIWLTRDPGPNDLTSFAPALPPSRPLTSDPGLEHQPRLAAGGDWVVYAALRPDRGDWDVLRVSTDDNVAQALAATPGVHEHGPAISPDGESIAYVRLRSNSCDVVSQSMMLGVPEVLAGCTAKFPTLVDWSPDGSLLAYTAAESDDEAGRRRLHAVHLADNSRRPLTSGVSPSGTDFYPRFSPSGRQLAFLRGEPQPDHRTTIWTVDVESGSERKMTELPAQYGGMTWLDERNILYSVNDAGNFELRILDIESGRESTIEGHDLVHLEYDAERGWLVGAARRSERALAIIDGPGEERGIALSTSDDHHGVFSEDGKFVAFISNRSGHDELWIADVQTGAGRALTRFDGAAVRYPTWNPDGRQILFTVQSESGERLILIDVVSGNTRQVETGALDATTPAWMPDGERWVFGCRDAEGWGVCLGNDAGTQRIASGYFRPTPVDDGTIAVVDSRGTLYRMEADDGRTEQVWDGLPAGGRYGWALLENTLIYAASGRTFGNARLIRRDLGTNEETVVYTGPVELADGPLSIHPATGSILFTRFGAASDDLVIFEGVSPARLGSD